MYNLQGADQPRTPGCAQAHCDSVKSRSDDVKLVTLCIVENKMMMTEKKTSKEENKRNTFEFMIEFVVFYGTHNVYKHFLGQLST